MAEDDQYPVHSPLGQSLTRDGKTVSVEIYDDGKGQWILTDQDALNEVLGTVDEDGIESLIGMPSANQTYEVPCK